MKINKKVCLYCGKPLDGDRLFICEKCEKSKTKVGFNDIKAIWFLMGLFLGTIECEALTEDELAALANQTPLNILDGIENNKEV